MMISGKAACIMISPDITNASLLASNTLLPALIAASVVKVLPPQQLQP
jgi:hypothetical protein